MAEKVTRFLVIVPFPSAQHKNKQNKNKQTKPKKKAQDRCIGTYLFNGICSNGPEVGIVPHKSLLETSLKIS